MSVVINKIIDYKMSTRTQHTTPAIQPSSQPATSNQSGLHMADILLSDHSIFELGGIVLFANNPLTLVCQFLVLFCRSYRNQYQTKRLIFSNTVACMVHLMNQHIRFPWQGDHHFGEVAKMLRKQKIFLFFSFFSTRIGNDLRVLSNVKPITQREGTDP